VTQFGPVLVDGIAPSGLPPLMFAGEHTAYGFIGYMEGALSSGIRAARLLLGTDARPAKTAPADTAPAETQPAETQPTDATPAETEPADAVPAEPAPAEPAPAEPPPAEPAPTEAAVEEPVKEGVPA
jgi:outer membrane biosynthesis protein TonB